MKVLADKDWLRIDKVENGIRKLRIGANGFGEVGSFDGFGEVDFHGKIVVFDPFFRDALKFAGFGIFDDFDTGNGLKRFALIEFFPLIECKFGGVESLGVFGSHECAV